MWYAWRGLYNPAARDFAKAAKTDFRAAQFNKDERRSQVILDAAPARERGDREQLPVLRADDPAAVAAGPQHRGQVPAVRDDRPVPPGGGLPEGFSATYCDTTSTMSARSRIAST